MATFRGQGAEHQLAFNSSVGGWKMPARASALSENPTTLFMEPRGGIFRSTRSWKRCFLCLFGWHWSRKRGQTWRMKKGGCVEEGGPKGSVGGNEVLGHVAPSCKATSWRVLETNTEAVPRIWKVFPIECVRENKEVTENWAKDTPITYTGESTRFLFLNGARKHGIFILT